MKKHFFLVIALTLANYLMAQNVNPAADEIYREDEVAVITITMDPADKTFLLDDANIWSDIYLHAAFQFTNSLIDTALVEDVGIRLRGNTSRGQPKRSFKIKFKEFNGSKFFGYKKFNLKAENNDPTMVRELLTMQTFRQANVPAARTHHAKLYINDEYMGIYLNVEQIDDEFALSRFNYDKGNLYKCTWPATLEDDGQIFNNDTYELKTNKDLNDRSLLENFIKVLNNTPANDFEEAIENVFNVNSYLHYLAVEALTGHWDGYSYNKNNYYLYENNDTGLIEFIPYDVDNTFGIDWIGGDWGTHNVLDWAKKDEARPLTKRILAREEYLDQYKNILDQLLNGDFSEAYFFPVFDNFKSMLASSISTDTYFPLTFGFNFQDFENSYTQEVVAHAPYGLKPYITTRTSTAREQISTVTGLTNETYAHFSVYPNPSNSSSLFIFSDKSINNVLIKDVLGRQNNIKVISQSGNSYKLEFILTPGLYIINVDGYTEKFIVK